MLSQGIAQCKNEFTKQRALFDQCSFVLALSQHSEVMAEKAKKAAVSTTEAGRVGDRPYARGRSYKADRYDESETK